MINKGNFFIAFRLSLQELNIKFLRIIDEIPLPSTPTDGRIPAHIR